MTAILISDLHLSDRPRDEYRFEIFEWLINQAKKFHVTHIFILGDFTDVKDRHQATFVHKCVNSIEGLLKADLKVGMLKGNHDEISSSHPYFSFLEKLSPNLHYYQEPTFEPDWWIKPVIWLPFDRSESVFQLDAGEVEGADYVLMHQTLNGSRASSGLVMPGLDPAIFEKWKPKIYSGDIHLPQIVGKVEYVGAPYRTTFGDNYKGRCIVLGKDKARDIHFPCIEKVMINMDGIEELDKLINLNSNDQVKIKLHIPQAQVHEWENLRKEILIRVKEKNLDVQGIELFITDKRVKANNADKRIKEKTQKEIFDLYCKREKISGKIKTMGADLL